MKKTAVMLLVLWTVVLTGCNTMHGFGRDVEKAGEAIQRKSDR